ncbi:MAG: hypothetical protein LC797_10800 [Chloroflexi bacterium]|nr:hypothetical protein [Chloroflexota bacterium]
MARLEPRSGLALVPWVLEALPSGNSVILAASDVALELDRTIGQLEDAGFHVSLFMALDQTRTAPRRAGTITITSGCDLAARLEGRA